MNEIANTLRMYAEDIHSAVGHSDCSTAMSKAADRLEELEKERDKLILAVADHVTARCELAAQNVAMREALNTVLDAVIALEVEQSDYLLRSSVVLKATDALNIPNTASEVLKRRDAEVLRLAADRLQGEFYEHAAADVLRMVSITPDD